MSEKVKTALARLISILRSLMYRRDKFDYIMIETTGLVDPGPVATCGSLRKYKK